ncbi:hypothetical protein Purlil1_12265 [Purpureocillium lilacinum]|uniref:Uncharacterized protein n=1 Tax=Purpureocillium lilacinum TaxID=33203 RepID=A0ABR0BHA3_PURLI|nr:hypothetical protein Purlil1_12265 [Purpureocillium lilacinum]
MATWLQVYRPEAYKFPEPVNRIGKALPPSVCFRAPAADAQPSSPDADRPALTAWGDTVNRLDVTTKMIYMFKQFIPAFWMPAFDRFATLLGTPSLTQVTVIRMIIPHVGRSPSKLPLLKRELLIANAIRALLRIHEEWEQVISMTGL